MDAEIDWRWGGDVGSLETSELESWRGEVGGLEEGPLAGLEGNCQGKWLNPEPGRTGGGLEGKGYKCGFSLAGLGVKLCSLAPVFATVCMALEVRGGHRD